jgi:archaemetzincin
MAPIKLVTINFTDYNLVTPLLSEIAHIMKSRVFFNKLNWDIDKFYSKERGQYDASGILKELESVEVDSKTIIYTSLDLYIPIFTFIFGLAKLGGNTAIISSHRLRNEFYGLPKNDPLLHQRLLKETFHELGHLQGLKHCSNYYCVMTSSTNTEELDLKGHEYCAKCISQIEINDTKS